MNTKKIGIILLFFLAVTSQTAEARRGDSESYLRPQIGLWFGPITPVFSTGEVVDTDLGVGLYFRYNTPYKPLKIGVDASYQNFRKREGVNELTLWPVYGNLLYKLPIRFPLTFLVKAGAGGCNVRIEPDDKRQWDPMGMIGFETSFPAGRVINIGIRIDYLFIYEGRAGGGRNGHIVNTGLTVYFNL